MCGQGFCCSGPALKNKRNLTRCITEKVRGICKNSDVRQPYGSLPVYWRGDLKEKTLTNSPPLTNRCLNCQLSFSLHFCLFVCGAECVPVGVEDRNKIPDGRMTASTYYSNDYHPYYGRLNGNRGYGVWCPQTKSDSTDYLQVDMGAEHSVCAVATQGETVYSEWTTNYKVHLSTDGVTWNSYKENNVEKVTKIIYSCLGEEVYREIFKLSH